MDHLVIELPPKAEQDAFNRLRWEELSRRTDLARFQERIRNRSEWEYRNESFCVPKIF